MKKAVITIKDVARLAGVGIGTASYSLNGKGASRVSEATRQKVIAVAEKLHYKPNTFGRALKMRSSRVVGVIVPTVIHSAIPLFIQGIQDELTRVGYSSLFYTYANLHDLEAKCQNLLNWQVEGIIFNPQDPARKPWLYEYLQKLAPTLPIVGGGGMLQGFFPWVLVDGETIGRIGTEHLLAKGHQRIALVNDFDDWRTRGYMQALKNAGLKPDYNYVYNDYEAMYDIQRGFLHWLESFPMETRPTAVFCLNESMTARLMTQAIDRKYVLPKDLSFLATDLSELNDIMRPRISTLAQPHYQQGVEAVRLLMRILDGQKPENVLLQPELVVKDSIFDLTQA